jgi:phage/plasmid-like protein (TIGR03299 family)
MSANLATQANGTAMIAYARETPWHNQGTKVSDTATGMEMLKAAGLDFDILARPMKTDTGLAVPNAKATVRTDTNEVIGIVGESYTVFQNREMVQFFEDLVQGHKISYEVAGALGNGNKVWVLARIPELSYAIKGDEMVSFMLICNGHDGSQSLKVTPTNVRCVCSNTLRMASREFIQRKKLYGRNSIHAGYQIRHTSNMRGALDQALQAYQNCLEDAIATKELFTLLADKPVTDAQIREYFQKVSDLTKADNDREKEKASAIANAREEKRIEELKKLWEAPTNQTNTKGTAFAAYNTVVEWVDFNRGTRKTDGKSEDSARFESSMFGSGDAIKSKALLEVMELVGV